ncbi:hypothetical protein EPN42_06685 [bacterium]|nr:MAG: hypothetical protein EPN42_06685 [bacterium]
MLFKEQEVVDPRVALDLVGANLGALNARVAALPAGRRPGFEQVIAQARTAMADQHVEFAEALASVLEVAISEAEDDQRRPRFMSRR